MQVLSLLRLEALALWRWLRENAFTVLVIAPLVIGGAGVIFQPYLEAAGEALRGGTGAWLREHAGAVAGPVVVALVLARLSGTMRDVFALAESDFYLDALPIGPLARLHGVLVARIAKALPVAVVAAFAAYLAAPSGTTAASTAVELGPALALGAAALGVVETGAALALVRLRIVGSARLLGVGALAAAASVAAAPFAVWLAAGVTTAGYAVAVYGFARWRIEDRDVAQEALARARRSSATFERVAGRALGSRVGAQVVRDLRLVRRGFSTEPYVAAIAAVLATALAAWAGRRFELSAEQHAHAIAAATVLAAYALGAVTHALVQHERTRVWIDLVSGVEREDFPRAKLWVARALAAPAFVLGCAAMYAAGLGPGLYAAIELAWLSWSTATMTAVFCYEIKERPAAGLVLAFLPAAGIGLMVVFYPAGHILWYIALFTYFYVTFHMLDRAGQKVVWDEGT